MEKKSQQLFDEIAERILKTPPLACGECPLKGHPCLTASCRAMSLLKDVSDALTNVGEDGKSACKTPEQIGKDINVSATLPAWCKEGAWVFHNGCNLGKIEGFEVLPKDGSTPPTIYVLVTSYNTHNRFIFTRLPKQIQPVRFRKHTFEEAKALIGKTMEYKDGLSRNAVMISKICQFHSSADLFINDLSFGNLKNRDALIDEVPLGVPEVDEEAMRNGAEGEESVPCDTCKHSRWFGEYGMQVCEKRDKDCPFQDCYDATKGGAK